MMAVSAGNDHSVVVDELIHCVVDDDDDVLDADFAVRLLEDEEFTGGSRTGFARSAGRGYGAP